MLSLIYSDNGSDIYSSAQILRVRLSANLFLVGRYTSDLLLTTQGAVLPVATSSNWYPFVSSRH